MNAETSKGYPDTLADWAGRLAALLVEEGLADDRSRDLAHRFIEIVRREYGGTRLYIARGVTYDRELLKREIFRRWNGANTRALLNEFDITDSYLRRLHEEARREALAERQPSLLGEPVADEGGEK